MRPERCAGDAADDVHLTVHRHDVMQVVSGCEPRRRGDRRDAVVVANGVIRDEIGERGSLAGVVGWFAHGADDGMITGDGVHLTDRGQEAFATAIANQVRSIYRR